MALTAYDPRSMDGITANQENEAERAMRLLETVIRCRRLVVELAPDLMGAADANQNQPRPAPSGVFAAQAETLGTAEELHNMLERLLARAGRL